MRPANFISGLTCSRFPEEVVVSDIVISTPADGIAAPSEGDDFFSSWDKPSIKRPSNPPSRTQTPPVISRTGSPFLNAGANGTSQTRSKSPLNGENETQVAASRAVPSTAVRKTPTAGGPRKANILGAKKTQKLGAKKVGGADAVDFDEAERKAKEEAERIAKLGYDPDAEEAEAKKTIRSASISEKTKMAAPTPINPARPSGTSGKGHERTKSEMERLGMGMGRLGFGQVGSSKPAAATTSKKMGSFGSVGPIKAAEEGTHPIPLSPSLPSLLTNQLRRRREIRAPKVRHTEGHIIRRVLRASQLRSLRPGRIQATPPRIRGCYIHLQQCVLWSPRR